MAYMDKINVLLVSPYKLPKVIQISNTLNSMQKLVNGCIEVSCLLNDDNVCIVYNEKHKFNSSPPNRIISKDIIYGNFFVIGNDDEKGDFKSLTKQQIEKYFKMFDKDSIARLNSKLNARKMARAIVYKR